MMVNLDIHVFSSHLMLCIHVHVHVHVTYIKSKHKSKDYSSTSMPSNFFVTLFFLCSMLQACQYVIAQKAVYSLGKVSSATTWVINNAEPSQFKFTIHYQGGDEER